MGLKSYFTKGESRKRVSPYPLASDKVRYHGTVGLQMFVEQRGIETVGHRLHERSTKKNTRNTWMQWINDWT